MNGVAVDHTTISLLKGEDPEIYDFETGEEEIEFVADRIRKWLQTGLAPRDIAILGRSRKRVIESRAIPALKSIDLSYHWLKPSETELPDSISVWTMHSAKGLEFKAVVVMGCEEGVIPHPLALRDCDGDVARQEVIEQERNLLYVSTTRAREEVVITYVGEGSELLG